jgi:hypothetical protein
MQLLVDQIPRSGKKANLTGPATIPTGFLYNTPVKARQPSGPDVRFQNRHIVFSPQRRTVLRFASCQRTSASLVSISCLSASSFDKVSSAGVTSDF